MKNLNVFEIFKSSQFAFIKGNRPTDEKAIKAKKDSLAEYGMLCPITAVNGKAHHSIGRSPDRFGRQRYCR